MKQRSHGSRSSLFLIELILSLLVFSLVSTVCIRFFAASWNKRKSAREWNHIQELTVNAAEILEAGSGLAEDFHLLFPEGDFSDSQITASYNSRWEPCDAGDAAYVVQLQFSSDSWSKGMELTFQTKEDKLLYSQEIRYPHLPEQEGGGPDE